MSLTFFKRFETFENYNLTWTGATSGPTDGVNIAKELDYYVGWDYHKAALPGLLAAGKMMQCYLNVRNCDDRYSYYDVNFILRNASGGIVASKGWDGHLHVADPMSPLWREALRARIAYFKSLGFTGVFLDNGVEVDVPTQYTFDSHPVNPRTGQLYTDADFVRDCIDQTNWLKAQFPSMYMVANGFWSGLRYDQKTSGHQYVMENLEIDAIFSEGMWGNIYGFLWLAGDWRRSVNFLRLLQDAWIAKGRDFVTYTNCGGADNPYSGDQGRQSNGEVIGWERAASFHFCSALLAATRSGNILSLHNSMSRPYVQSLFQVDVGEPMEEYRQIGTSGIYTRRWSKVQPFVNPQEGTRTVNVADLNLVDTEGYAVEAVTIPAKTGLLLYQAEAPEYVTLSYLSVPSGVDAEVDGETLSHGQVITLLKDSQVKLKVPLRVEL